MNKISTIFEIVKKVINVAGFALQIFGKRKKQVPCESKQVQNAEIETSSVK